MEEKFAWSREALWDNAVLAAPLQRKFTVSHSDTSTRIDVDVCKPYKLMIPYNVCVCLFALHDREDEIC